MNEKNHIIMAIHVTDRFKHVQKMQEALTEYGCLIKTRLGLHDASDDHCSSNGLIILELLGKEDKAKELENTLNGIEGLETKKVIFTHPES